MKNPLKRNFPTENRKKGGSATPFLLSLFRYFQKKNSQISVQVAYGDHIVTNQTDDICFSLDIKDYW